MNRITYWLYKNITSVANYAASGAMIPPNISNESEAEKTIREAVCEGWREKHPYLSELGWKLFELLVLKFQFCISCGSELERSFIPIGNYMNIYRCPSCLIFITFQREPAEIEKECLAATDKAFKENPYSKTGNDVIYVKEWGLRLEYCGSEDLKSISPPAPGESELYDEAWVAAGNPCRST